MTLEFTPKDIGALLTPYFRGVRNRQRHAGRGDRLRALLFTSIGLLFALFVFAGFYRVLLYIGQFDEFTAPLTHRVLDTVSTFVLTVLLASTVVTALATQYLSDDLSLLVSSPIPLPALYGARLILTLLQSSWMVVLFSVPVYAAFAATAMAPVALSRRRGSRLPPADPHRDMRWQHGDGRPHGGLPRPQGQGDAPPPLRALRRAPGVSHSRAAAREAIEPALDLRRHRVLLQLLDAELPVSPELLDHQRPRRRPQRGAASGDAAGAPLVDRSGAHCPRVLDGPIALRRRILARAGITTGAAVVAPADRRDPRNGEPSLRTALPFAAAQGSPHLSTGHHAVVAASAPRGSGRRLSLQLQRAPRELHLRHLFPAEPLLLPEPRPRGIRPRGGGGEVRLHLRFERGPRLLDTALLPSHDGEAPLEQVLDRAPASSRSLADPRRSRRTTSWERLSS